MPNRRRRTGGGVHRETAQPPQQQNPVRPSPSFLQNPNAFHLQQNPNFSSHLENFRQNTSNQPPVRRQFPDRNFAIPSNSENDDLQPPRRNTSFSNFPQLQGAVRNVTVEKLDRAAMIAHRDLLASKENISVWKVSQAALLMVKAESWESLGFQIQQVPSLKHLLVTEGKVNSFIHCYVAVRRIVSLFDLEVAICKSEGIEHFEELELGPLARHQLAVHYFSVPSDVMEAYRIRTEVIITYLCEFLDTHKKKDHNVDTFLDFVAMKQSVASKEKLSVRIQNFGQYIKFIKTSRLSERTILTNYLKKDETGTPNKAERKIRRRLLSFALKQPLVDHFTLTPQLTISPSERLVSSSLEMDDRENSDYDELQDEEKLPKLDKLKTFPKHMGSGNLGSNHPLVNKSLRLFITTWKGRCQRYEAHELLDRMLEYYQNKKRARIKTLFTSEPLVGLLNVAVSSLKFGMWDGYEFDNAFDLTDVDRKETFDSSADYTSIDVKANEKDRNEHGFSAEDIVNKISGYFEDDFFSHRNPSRGNKFLFLRKLCKSENWLIGAYSVKEFESLGYGEYFMFLEKYIHLFPYALQKCLMGDMNENFPLKAYLLPLQFGVLLSQAINSLSENESINLQQVSELLARQFPLVCFDLVKSDLQENLMDILREKRFKLNSNSLLFSAPLLGLHCMDDSFAQNEKNMEETCGFGIIAGYGEGSAMAITADATEIFLKAPMLVDLNLWSHWDLLFAPSLGSIVEWLLNEVNSRELLCLVTRDGKIIRVDHSATTDSFLEVLIQRSAFETALKLLSLFALYGGEQHIPISLLKCHARQAFEINGKSMLNKVVPAMSAFILDCLSFLPIEFCSFAADVLISGLQSFVKDVPLAILSECKQFQQRIMLHHVGISLGIVEWMNDYHSLSASATTRFSPGSSCLDFLNSELNTRSMNKQDVLNKHNAFSGEVLVSSEAHCADSAKVAVDDCAAISQLSKLPNNVNDDPVGVIESIRKEEFGLGKNLSDAENKMLEKQHARLGRALQCLSQELYSQDSHFLLELVQNADDNVYPESVEPTLMIILQEESIVVLNNEQGFQANNIRALCDVGNSTKKGHNAGYIGKKGIGFKSVFRVTDAPEIHSNGFHIKFDITQGQIGFVLPTIVPPFDIGLYTRLASGGAEPINQNVWNTCIVLPFRSSFSEGFTMNNIVSMFSDLHPSMLLFLHRLQCIKFRNMFDDSLIAMRKEVIGGGIIRVALGDDKMTWLVASQKLQASVIHSDVQTTEISVAFTLQETDAEGFVPILIKQPVFAFLPLRAYGLKFILQGDFVLPSSREEVDGSSPWNQWLLSQFPDLFVSAEGSFCDLPCFRICPGKAVTAFMSFIPLIGEAHGFFSSLPRMIISKLRTSNCMLLECKDIDWVPPCKVLRNWTEQSRILLPDSLLHEHAGLGFLNRDIVLSDTLARALGIEEYGPKILLKVISSLCRSHNGIKSMGLSWLCSWLNAIFLMSSHSYLQTFPSFVTEPDLILKLKKVPFIPLSCGKYGSLDGQKIWLHSDAVDGINGEFVLKSFPTLYAKLQTVSPDLLAAASSIENSFSDTSVLENVTRMLYKLGVQRLSAHEILKVHILPAISAAKNAMGQEELMIEYLSFAMFHLQSSCAACSHERSGIIRELHMKALISTNHGYKRSNEVPIHLTREFGNPVDADKLISGLNVKWLEIDSAYMQHPITKSLSGGNLKWRKFFQEIGVTDFVKIVQVEKTIADMSLVNMKDIMYFNDKSLNCVAQNWESEELLDLLSSVSSRNDGEKSKYMLEILDRLWDDYFSDKTTCYCVDSSGEHRPFKSSLVSNLQDVPWISSSIDNELHYPKDLFQDCMAVHSVLGINAPYAIPKVRNEKLLADIGLRTQVTLDDALYVLRVWRKSKTSFKASVSQMSNFYALLWKGMELSKNKIIDTLHSGPFIFVPHAYGCSKVEDVDGALLSLQEVYWHDNTCPTDQIVHPECVPSMASHPLRKILSIFYPSLHDFFVDECGVDETPPLCSYLQILLQLSAVVLPHQAAKKVFEVILKWGDALESKSLSLEDVEFLKESLLKKEYSVLPTKQDKWVSLHASFGLICWCDDDNLGSEFNQVAGVDFLYFGDFTDEENRMIQAKVSTILRTLGVPTLSEMVTREPIYYGPADCNFISSMVNWILPYAQRYILNAYPDKYFQFKQSGFKNITHLKIVVVEKLFYRNVIGRSDIISKKRHECNCLLQDNILYCNQGSDPHSIFLEFSRLLYNGNPILEVANFLHMITTMAESGATKEQMEFFIVNNQKVPKLPAEESCWLLLSTSFSADTHGMLLENFLPKKAKELNSPMFKRKIGINSNWPPEDWKTAPGFSAANTLQLKKPASISQQITEGNAVNENFEQTSTAPPVIADELNIEAGPMASIPGEVLLGSEITESQPTLSTDVVFGSFDLPTDQALLIGRLGEMVAFKYFLGEVGDVLVKWVNEGNETGLPYDIIIGNDEVSREYIEVKATKFEGKNWFHISMREWQFAIEKGERYSIAHVVLSDDDTGKVVVYKHPTRLCQLGKMKLAVVVPKQH